MRHLLLFFLLLSWWGAGARASEVMLPAPKARFNDYAGLVAPEKVRSLEQSLAILEQETSRSLIIVIYPSLPADALIEEYPAKLAHAWGFAVGERQNQAVVFIFAQEQQVRIVAGAKLADLLPAVFVQQIAANELTPRMRTGDHARGLEALTHALVKVTTGDDRGNQKAAGRRDQEDENDFGVGGFALILCGVVGLSMLREFLRRHIVYTGTGRQTVWINPLSRSREPGGDGFTGGGTGGSW